MSTRQQNRKGENSQRRKKTQASNCASLLSQANHRSANARALWMIFSNQVEWTWSGNLFEVRIWVYVRWESAHLNCRSSCLSSCSVAELPHTWGLPPTSEARATNDLPAFVLSTSNTSPHQPTIHGVTRHTNTLLALDLEFCFVVDDLS